MRRSMWLIICAIILIVIGSCTVLLKREAKITAAEESRYWVGDTDEVGPLKDFMLSMPEAHIHDVIVHDIDRDGKHDYIILYSIDNGSQQISAGLAVLLCDSIYSGINLDSNNYLSFASNATLVEKADCSLIKMDLKDKSAIYTFTVEYTINSESQEVNYSIKSELKESR